MGGSLFFIFLKGTGDIKHHDVCLTEEDQGPIVLVKGIVVESISAVHRDPALSHLFLLGFDFAHVLLKFVQNWTEST